jgi:DNA modification methylase
MWLLGDWRDHIAGLEDGSGALVLTDPPYGMAYRSGFRQVPHEAIVGDESPEEAAGELQAALEELYPKVKGDAHVLVFCSWRVEPAFRKALEEAGYDVRASLVWVKNNTGMGDLQHTFAPKHERIIHAVKGAPVLLEREYDVLECARVGTDRHPTEKPVELLRRLIECTTAAGELVADPFGGVASTLAAALEVHRRGWGCEIVEAYWAIGSRRLSGVVQDLRAA